MSNDQFGRPAGTTLVDLGAYRRDIARAWPIVALLAILGGLGGWLLGERAPELYASTAVVQVSEGLVSLTTSSREAIPNMATEQQVARSTVVTAIAAERLGTGLSATEFQRRTRASSPADANTLALTFEAPTPAEARAGATEWGNAYLENRGAKAVADVGRARGQVAASAQDLEDELTAAQTAAVAATPGTSAAASAEARVRLLTEQLAPVRGQLYLLNSLIVDPGRVISEPQPPERSQGLSAVTYGIAGLLVGLVVGAALGVAYERKFSRVRSTGDVRSLVGRRVWRTGVLSATPGDTADPVIGKLAAQLSTAMSGHVAPVLVTVLGPPQLTNSVAEHLTSALVEEGVDAIEHWGVPGRRGIDDGPDHLSGSHGDDGTLAVAPRRAYVRSGDDLLTDSVTEMLVSESAFVLLVLHGRRTRLRQVRAVLRWLTDDGVELWATLLVSGVSGVSRVSEVSDDEVSAEHLARERADDVAPATPENGDPTTRSSIADGTSSRR